MATIVETSRNVPYVRAAGKEGDLQTLIDFNFALALETEAFALDKDILRRGCERILRDPSRGRYFVICEPASSSSSSAEQQEPSSDSDPVVGQLMITTEWSDWRASDIWWIQSVYVRPASRRKGHFRKLYNHARRVAQEEGAAGLRLYAEVENFTAHETYGKLGMKTGHYQVFEDMFGEY